LITLRTMIAPPIRTSQRRCEVAWFSALCGDIVRKADTHGFQNILLPSGWIAGQDALTFAAAMAAQTQQINQLVALRMGEVWPPMLAVRSPTVDHISKRRICIHIISSDLPGQKERTRCATSAAARSSKSCKACGAPRVRSSGTASITTSACRNCRAAT